MAKIIDFDYGEPHAAYRLAVLKYDNDITEQVNYIRLYISKSDDKVNSILELINKIYSEHIKLKLLGLGYPIYKIITYTEGVLRCSLEGFDTTSGNLDTYIVPSFVDEIYFDYNHRTLVKEIKITKPIHIKSLGESRHIKLINVNKLLSIRYTIMSSIVKSIENNALVLDNLEYSTVFGSYIGEIHSIVLNNTCTIQDIPACWFKAFNNLEEITLSRSVTHIGNEKISCYIVEQNGKQYIDTSLMEPDSKNKEKRLVEVKFSYK